jgi:hypothetical protein
MKISLKNKIAQKFNQKLPPPTKKPKRDKHKPPLFYQILEAKKKLNNQQTTQHAVAASTTTNPQTTPNPTPTTHPKTTPTILQNEQNQNGQDCPSSAPRAKDPNSLSETRELIKASNTLQSLHATKAGRSIIRASKRLADYITEQDIAESAQVIREAKKAVSHYYNIEQKRMVEIPDFKIRLAAATLERAYDEGTPVQRQIVMSGKFDTDEAILGQLAANEEARRAIETLAKFGLHVQPKAELPEPNAAERIIDAEIVQQERATQ